jgi:hypothetical protein
VSQVALSIGGLPHGQPCYRGRAHATHNVKDTQEEENIKSWPNTTYARWPGVTPQTNDAEKGTQRTQLVFPLSGSDKSLNVPTTSCVPFLAPLFSAMNSSISITSLIRLAGVLARG